MPDLCKFIYDLHDDLLNNEESWENINLPSFLEAMAAWVESSDEVIKPGGGVFTENEPWGIVAMLLYVGSRYE